MNEFIMEFQSIWSELSVGGKIEVGLTIFMILFLTGCAVTLVWKLIPKNRWGYRLMSVPVVTTLSLVFLVWGLVKLNEIDMERLSECRDTWAYRYGGRSC